MDDFSFEKMLICSEDYERTRKPTRKLVGILIFLKARPYNGLVKNKKACLWYPFADTCSKYPNNRALWSRDGSYTFQEVRDQSIQWGHWFLEQGIVPGDLVAMYLINSPDFMIIWMGLLSIGCAPAFINYNLEGPALIHCLGVCDTKLLLVDEDEGCQERIRRTQEHIESKGVRLVTVDHRLKLSLLLKTQESPPDQLREGVVGESPVCLIYTR